MNLTEADVRRFWAKVALPDENGCMRWLASISKDGYGRFSIKACPVYATRVSLWLASGPAQDGQEAAHSCRSRDCVAPAHLRWASKAENEADKIGAGSTKLTPEEAIEIRRRFTPGSGAARLAAEFGVSSTTVRKIGQGLMWASVTEVAS